MKESLIKNKKLKIIDLKHEKNELTDILDNEYHLIYKLLKLTQNKLTLSFSNKNYSSSYDIKLKLNYLKCFIDDIDLLFFNFHNFDINFFFKNL
jgi:hypothetical protein